MLKGIAKMIIFPLFFFVSINSFYCVASVRAKVYTCSGKEKDPTKGTAKKLITGLNTAAKDAPNCLPPGLANSVKYNALSLEIKIKICDIEDCAEADILDHSITVGAKTLEGKCGCTESVMLHELLHLGGLPRTPEDEIKAESCELKCYPECAVVSSSQASKEKCCDEKSKK